MAKTMANLGQGAEALAGAVVMQAAQDWRWAVKTLRKDPGNQEAQALLKEEEEFFCSRRFRYFCRLNGKKLLARLRAEARKEVAA